MPRDYDRLCPSTTLTYQPLAMNPGPLRRGLATLKLKAHRQNRTIKIHTYFRRHFAVSQTKIENIMPN